MHNSHVPVLPASPHSFLITLPTAFCSSFTNARARSLENRGGVLTADRNISRIHPTSFFSTQLFLTSCFPIAVPPASVWTTAAHSHPGGANCEVASIHRANPPHCTNFLHFTCMPGWGR